MPYLTLPEFRDLTLTSTEIVDHCETRNPGWIARQLAFHSDRIDSRLRKRYAVPFAPAAVAPLYPPTITGWLTAVVTPLVMLKAGMAAEDELLVSAKELAAAAEAQLSEAANAATGLFELPLRADTAVGGVSQGAPLAYTETSPYRWRDVQRERGREDDEL
jgi:hypothetical protein